MKGKRAEIGDIRTWEGRRFRKISSSRWVEIKETGTTELLTQEILNSMPVHEALPIREYDTIGDLLNEYDKHFVNAKIFDARGKRVNFERRHLFHLAGFHKAFNREEMKRMYRKYGNGYNFLKDNSGLKLEFSAEVKNKSRSSINLSSIPFSGLNGAPAGVKKNGSSDKDNIDLSSASQEIFSRIGKIFWILSVIKKPDLIIAHKSRENREIYIKRFKNESGKGDKVFMAERNIKGNYTPLTSFDVTSTDSFAKWLAKGIADKSLKVLYREMAMKKAFDNICILLGMPRLRFFFRAGYKFFAI